MLRILKRNKFKPCKTTKKSGLTEEMKKARLMFCKMYEHWTLEDWRNVIWTDETSVVIGSRRGNRTRIWRRANEIYAKKCCRPRWKRFCEFMFWGCFSYDHKGPMHCWKPETPKQKKEAEEELAELNEVLEPYVKADWEAKQKTLRASRKGRGGRRAVWKWDKSHGKIVRDSGGGIDWYRYQKYILLPKLIPFAQNCMKTRPRTAVVEDGAPSHASKQQNFIYMKASVLRLLWPGNSPDLNMIEPCWNWMKREITRKGAPQTRAQAEHVWTRAWKKLDQSRIQDWMSQIPRHIKEVTRLDGGNEYREGKAGGESDIRPYDEGERKARYERAKVGVMREDLNLNGEDTDTEVMPRMTRARTQATHAQLSEEQQARQDAREIHDLNAQIARLDISENVTQRRHRRAPG